MHISKTECEKLSTSNAMAIKECPLCGEHTLQVPLHRRYEKFGPEKDAFISKCRSAGLTFKVISRLMGVQRHQTLLDRIKRMNKTTSH